MVMSNISVNIYSQAEAKISWNNSLFILMIPNIIEIYRNERKHMMMHVILFINRNIKQCLPSMIKSSKSHHTSIIKPTFIHYQRK